MHPLVISVDCQDGFVFLLTKILKMVEITNCGNHASFKFGPCILTYDMIQISIINRSPNYNNKVVFGDCGYYSKKRLGT
jgi:hypothetical protein